MRITQKIDLQINDAFPAQLHAFIKRRYNIILKTEYNIFSEALVSRRADGKRLTIKQRSSIGDFSDGYAAAKTVAREAE